MGWIELVNLEEKQPRVILNREQPLMFHKTSAFNVFHPESRFHSVRVCFNSMNHDCGPVHMTLSLYAKQIQRDQWSYVTHVLHRHPIERSSTCTSKDVKLPLEYPPDSWDLAQPQNAWFHLGAGRTRAFFQLKLIFSFHFGSHRRYTFSAESPHFLLVADDHEKEQKPPKCLYDEEVEKDEDVDVEEDEDQPLVAECMERKAKRPRMIKHEPDQQAKLKSEMEKLHNMLREQELVIQVLRDQLAKAKRESKPQLSQIKSEESNALDKQEDEELEEEELESTLEVMVPENQVKSSSSPSSSSSSSSPYLQNSAAIRKILPPHHVCTTNPIHMLSLALDPSFVLENEKPEMESIVWQRYRFRKRSLAGNRRGELLEARDWVLKQCVPFLVQLRELVFLTYPDAKSKQDSMALDGLLKLQAQIEEISCTFF